MKRSRSFLLAVVVLLTGCKACDELFDTSIKKPDFSNINRGVGQPCDVGDQCRSGLGCTDLTCQPLGQGVSGSSCTLTGDCGEGLFCGATRTCESAGTGVDGAQCESAADCARGLVCSVEGFFAVCRAAGALDIGGTCASTQDCLGGLVCVPNGAGQVCGSLPAQPQGSEPLPSIPYWPGANCATPADGEAPHAYFEVPREGTPINDFFRLPFPNDIYKSDGVLDLSEHPHPDTVAVDLVDRYLEAIAEDVDGFSTNPVMLFRFSRSYSGMTVGAESVRFYNITPGTPGYGNQTGRAWQTTSGRVSKYVCENYLGLKVPAGAPLRPGTTYAAIITTDLRTEGEASDQRVPFARDPDLEALLAASAPSDAGLSAAYAAYAPLRTFLADTSVSDVGSGTISTAKVLTATVFTTQNPEAVTSKLRAALRAAAAPVVSDLTVCADGAVSPCDDGTEERACGFESADYTEIHGRIALPIFQSGTAPYLTPEDGGGFVLDEDGSPVVQRTEPVCFALTIPKGGTKPADGWPLLVFAHGTGGSFTNAVTSGIAAWSAAGTFEALAVKAATLAIDLPQHGSRRGESTMSPDNLFFNFANPRAARDNIRQGAADLMSLAYWAEGYALGADASPTDAAIDFDAARFALFSHSQGSTHGSIALPYEPLYQTAVLSGNGGNLTQSLLNKNKPIDIAALLPYAMLDVNNGDGTLAGGAFNAGLAVFQTFFDSVDTVNYAWRIQREAVEGSTGASVFMTYGTGDSYSPPATMRAYAEALVLPQVTPTYDSIGLTEVSPPLMSNENVGGATRTIGLRQYQATEGSDGHFVAFDNAAAFTDVKRFLLQGLAGQAPVIGSAP